MASLDIPKIVWHNHHIIPKHAGGSNDKSNIIELTIEEHANAHKLLFEQYGKIEDFIAWKMLSGKTEECELERIELAKQGLITLPKPMPTGSKSNWNKYFNIDRAEVNASKTGMKYNVHKTR